MTTKQDLIAELKEKEKGCGKANIELAGQNNIKCRTLHLCQTCQAEITALQKGIDACDDLIKRFEKIIDDDIEFCNRDGSQKKDTHVIYRNIKRKLEQLKAEVTK